MTPPFLRLSPLGELGIKLNPTVIKRTLTALSTGPAAQHKRLILKSEGNELNVIQIRLCYYTWNSIKCHLRHLLVGIAV